MSGTHEHTTGGNDQAETPESPAGEETFAVGVAGGGGGADKRTDGRSETSNSQHVSPLSSRSGSHASSRCSSPAELPRSRSSPCSRPASPMSQGSRCGSMVPMYSPVALTEQAAADAATNSALRGRCGGRGAVGAAADLTRGEAEWSDGGRQPEDVGDSLATTSTNAEEVNATISRDGVSPSRNRVSGGSKRGEETSLAASDEEGHRLAANGAPGGGKQKNTTEKNGRESKQQLKKGNSGKRRGRGRSKKPTSARRHQETTAEKGGGEGNQDGGKKEKDRGSISPPHSGWGNQRERGGSARSRPGSPRGRGRRRRGAGRGGGNKGKAQRLLEAGDGTKAQEAKGVVRADAAAGDDYDPHCRKGKSDEFGVAEEAAVGPDPTEAEIMLQALAGLSKALQRLSRVEDSTAGCGVNAGADQLRSPLGGCAEAGRDEGDGQFEEQAPGAVGCGDTEKGLLRSISPARGMGARGSFNQPTSR